MADYAFSDLTTVVSSGLSTGFQVASTEDRTINTIFADSELESEDFSISGLTTLERGWNAPGRPQTGQMYPR
tara:strand:- start:6188 stop:6403 length:216 start_codon:yes stop_codon:yes gene_type:complete